MDCQNLCDELVNKIFEASTDLRPLMVVSKKWNEMGITCAREELYSRLNNLMDVILKNLELEKGDKSYLKLNPLKIKIGKIKEQSTLESISDFYFKKLWMLVRKAEKIDLYSYASVPEITPRKKLALHNRCKPFLEAGTYEIFQVFSESQLCIRKAVRSQSFVKRAINEGWVDRLKKRDTLCKKATTKLLGGASEALYGRGISKTHERGGCIRLFCFHAKKQAMQIQDQTLRTQLLLDLVSIQGKSSF